MTPIEKWLYEMRNIWITKDPDKISSILSPTSLQYFENPFDEPLTKFDDVVKEWQVIKNQDIEYITINVLNQSKNTGTAMWSFKQHNKPESRGCYYLELDEKGLCTIFRQWWNSQ